MGIGNFSYKASDLGKGRNLMASKIGQTWQKLHSNAGNTLQQDERRVKTNVMTDVRLFDNRIAIKSATDDETNQMVYLLYRMAREYISV